MIDLLFVFLDEVLGSMLARTQLPGANASSVYHLPCLIGFHHNPHPPRDPHFPVTRVLHVTSILPSPISSSSSARKSAPAMADG